MSQENKNKQKRAFSKTLLIQESALIWIMTLVFLYLAYLSIINGYMGSLPFLTAMVSLPWAAYGVSQALYYRKSQAENTEGGLTYEKMKMETQYSNSTSDTVTPEHVQSIIDGVSEKVNNTIKDTVGTTNISQDKVVYNSDDITEIKDNEFDSGNRIEDFPESQNKTVDYSNLNPDPEGPI